MHMGVSIFGDNRKVESATQTYTTNMCTILWAMCRADLSHKCKAGFPEWSLLPGAHLCVARHECPASCGVTPYHLSGEGEGCSGTGRGAAVSPQVLGEGQLARAWAGAGQSGQAWAAGAPLTGRSAPPRGWTWGPWGQAWGRAWWGTRHGVAGQGLVAGHGRLRGLAAWQQITALAKARGEEAIAFLCLLWSTAGRCIPSPSSSCS